jgi:hypothetical protein
MKIKFNDDYNRGIIIDIDEVSIDLNWDDVNYIITQLISLRDMKDSQVRYDKANGKLN